MDRGKVTSFGFRHGDPPPADITIDVRQAGFDRDPAARAETKGLRGTDPRVQAVVRGVPGFDRKLRRLVDRVRGARTAAIGCTSGHHRSVALAEMIALALDMDVVHRDVGKK